MYKRFDKDELVDMVNNIIERDDAVQIRSLSDELTISQVVKFFAKQNRNFTKTMIQNYVRVGVLPPPIDKRYYTKDHLVLLTLIESLKNIFSLEEIRLVLEPVRNNPEIFEDDIIKTIDIYNNYITMRKKALIQWKESLPQLFNTVNDTVDSDGINENEKAKAAAFIATLTIMAQTIAMKDLVNEIIKD